jgi:hypothetical protein
MESFADEETGTNSKIKMYRSPQRINSGSSGSDPYECFGKDNLHEQF